MKTIFPVMAVLALTACAHSFESARFDDKAWTPKGPFVEGVVYYDPQFFLTEYTYSALVEKGAIVGRAGEKACTPSIQKQEISIQPNLGDPRVIVNKPSMFASGNLKITLSNGMLTAVNSENRPQVPELLKEIRETAKVLVTTKGISGEPTPRCNAEPVITRFEPVTPGALPGARIGAREP